MFTIIHTKFLHICANEFRMHVMYMKPYFDFKMLLKQKRMRRYVFACRLISHENGEKCALDSVPRNGRIQTEAVFHVDWIKRVQIRSLLYFIAYTISAEEHEDGEYTYIFVRW